MALTHPSHPRGQPLLAAPDEMVTGDRVSPVGTGHFFPEYRVSMVLSLSRDQVSARLCPPPGMQQGIAQVGRGRRSWDERSPPSAAPPSPLISSPTQPGYHAKNRPALLIANQAELGTSALPPPTPKQPFSSMNLAQLALSSSEFPDE